MIKAIILSVSLFIPVQEHVHPDGVVQDPRVATFYDTWRDPKNRKLSCCSRHDCYSAQIRFHDGQREYLHKWTGQWFPLPNTILEAYSPDPRESPDGGNHVCASPNNGNLVYCAVLGEGG